MKPEFHVFPKPATFSANDVLLSAELLIGSSQPQTLWYRVPLQYESWLSPNHDPFVVATLLWAMRCSRALVVHGTVSKVLLDNLEYLQEIWSTWRPQRYQSIPIHVDHEEEAFPRQHYKRAICSFSGGVDSTYTVARYHQVSPEQRREHLVAGLMIHGLDIPLDQPEAFQAATQRGQRILNSVGMALVPLATNWRDVVDVPWEDGFGMAVAAGLMVFQGYCQGGLIASGRSYDCLKLPWGSTPLSDRECSSGHMTIRHDGADRDRFGKLQALPGWPEAMGNLRVCWQGPNPSENCCRCEKCIRTILALRLLGVENPPCFPHPVSDGQIRRLRLRGTPLSEMALIYHQARQQGNRSPWVRALGQTLWLNGWLNRLPLAASRNWWRSWQRG